MSTSPAIATSGPDNADTLPINSPPLRLVSSKQAVDVRAAAAAVRELLIALGQDPDDEHLRRTPQRVAAAYAEMFTTRDFELTTFANDEGYDELVLARDIPFSSLCEHHMLPFHGVAHVGYLPNKRIVGLSKLARMVQWCASGLQVQERLTQQIVSELDENLHAKGVGVVIEATHQCMTIPQHASPQRPHFHLGVVRTLTR